MRALVTLILLICSMTLTGQQRIIVRGIVMDGDTMPVIDLPKYTVSERMPAKLRRYYRRNARLIRNIRKVMPYAQTAAERLRLADEAMARIESESKKKKYYKQKEKELRQEFEDDLIKMNYSQGKLLIKLIDRETSKTTYSIIQNYRSNFSAVVWQAFAGIFGYNLKTGYDPTGRDKEIENIIIMLGYD